jgi:hypothetical protein
VLTRLPISGDVVCYLASEDYDPRDAASQSAAERRGRQQAWAYLDVLRSLPGCAGAYLASTGPEFGTREARHIEAVHRLAWQDVVEGRRSPTASRSAPGASNGTTARRCRAASSIRPTGRPTKSRCAAWRAATPRTCSPPAASSTADRQAGASLRVMGTAFATGRRRASPQRCSPIRAVRTATACAESCASRAR